MLVKGGPGVVCVRPVCLDDSSASTMQRRQLISKNRHRISYHGHNIRLFAISWLIFGSLQFVVKNPRVTDNNNYILMALKWYSWVSMCRKLCIKAGKPFTAYPITGFTYSIYVIRITTVNILCSSRDKGRKNSNNPAGLMDRRILP